MVQFLLSTLQQWPGKKAPMLSRYAMKHWGQHGFAIAVVMPVIWEFGRCAAERAIVAREGCMAARLISFIKLWFCLARGSQYEKIFSFVTSTCKCYSICFPKNWISADPENTCITPGSENSHSRTAGYRQVLPVNVHPTAKQYHTNVV